MSYTPNSWKRGDVITAEKLNNIEQGIVGAGGSLFVVNATNVANASTTTTQPELDKHVEEIFSAISAGKTVVIQWNIGGGPVGYGLGIANLCSVSKKNGTDEIFLAEFQYLYVSKDSSQGTFALQATTFSVGNNINSYYSILE